MTNTPHGLDFVRDPVCDSEPEGRKEGRKEVHTKERRRQNTGKYVASHYIVDYMPPLLLPHRMQSGKSKHHGRRFFHPK